jgi:hypothetical protein
MFTNLRLAHLQEARENDDNNNNTTTKKKTNKKTYSTKNQNKNFDAFIKALATITDDDCNDDAIISYLVDICGESLNVENDVNNNCPEFTIIRRFMDSLLINLTTKPNNSSSSSSSTTTTKHKKQRASTSTKTQPSSINKTISFIYVILKRCHPACALTLVETLLGSNSSAMATIITTTINSSLTEYIDIVELISDVIVFAPTLTERELLFKQMNELHMFERLTMCIKSQQLRENPKALPRGAKYSLTCIVQTLITGYRILEFERYNMIVSDEFEESSEPSELSKSEAKKEVDVCEIASLEILHAFMNNGLLDFVLDGKLLPLEAKAVKEEEGDDDEDDEEDDDDEDEFGGPNYPLESARFFYLLTGLVERKDPTLFQLLFEQGHVGNFVRQFLNWFIAKRPKGEYWGFDLLSCHAFLSYCLIAFARIFRGLGGMSSGTAVEFAMNIFSETVADGEEGFVDQLYTFQGPNIDVSGDYEGKSITDDDFPENTDFLSNPQLLIDGVEKCRRVFLYEYEGDEGYTARDAIYLQHLSFFFACMFEECGRLKEQMERSVGKNANKKF